MKLKKIFIISIFSLLSLFEVFANERNKQLDKLFNELKINNMKAQLVSTNGDVKSVKPKNNKTFSLKELQSYVDGYIQILKTRDERIMIINEEGKLNNLPYNEIASSLYIYGMQDPVVGDVLVMDKQMIN